MDQTLNRCLMARPKFGSPFAATAPAAPATFEFVYPQVVSRKEMAIAASSGYGRTLAYAIPGEAHHLSFGCFKAGPRYQLVGSITYKNKLERTPGLTLPCFIQSAHPSAASLRASVIGACG